MIDAVDLGAENDERMARLREALALGGGFQLVIVQVEPGEQREEVLRRLVGWSGRNGVPPLELVRLAAGESPVMRLAGEHAGVILVGLEAEGPDRGERTRQMVTELNWSRDRLPEMIRGSLVLVVSQRVQTELFEQAPDFYSWRTHTTSIAPQPRDPGNALPLEWLEIADTDPGDPDELESMVSRAQALRPPPLRELGLLHVRLASARSRLGEHAAVDVALDAAYRAFAEAGTADDRVNLLLLRGEVARQRGHIDEAAGWLDRARHEAQAMPPTPRVAARLPLFEVLLQTDRGHADGVTAALRSAIDAARAAGEPRLEAAAVLALAHMGGRHDDVLALLHRARDLCRQAEDPTWEARALEALARHAAASGRSDDAVAYGREAVARAKAGGSVDAVLEARANLAQIALDHDELDLAEDSLRPVVRGVSPAATGLDAEVRAALAHRRSEDGDEERHLQEALDAYRRGGDTARVARVSLDLARLAARTGNWTLAVIGFETVDRLGDARQRAMAALGLARLAFDREEWTATLADQFTAVVQMLVAVGAAMLADLARVCRGLVLYRLGREAEARAEWTTAFAGFEARGQAELAERLREQITELELHRD